MKFVSQALQCIHVSTLAVEMNRKQYAQLVALAAPQERRRLTRIEIKSRGIDIGEHGTCSGPRDGAGRSKKTEGCSQNLIARLQARSDQSQPQSVGAGGATHGIGRSAKASKFAFQFVDFRAENVMLRSADAPHRSQHFRA